MARQKLSEYRAKQLLSAALDTAYAGLSIDTAEPNWEERLRKLDSGGRYVVKADQAVKKRQQQGLLYVDHSHDQLADDVRALATKQFRYCLVEPLVPHAPESERYLAIERTRVGRQLTYAARGGVDIESDPGAVQRGLLEQVADCEAAARELGLPNGWLERLGEAFDHYRFSFLEINPLVVESDMVAILDAAVLVDDAAALLVDNAWTPDDYRSFSARTPTAPELAVAELAGRSQASLSLEVLNPDGAVFLLLSGGGASVVVADEIADRGLGDQLANYGEYSGNPNAEETQYYTAEVLKLLLASKAPRKVLIIAGGVANFTDVRATFTGVIKALTEYQEQLRQAQVKVYVRRGGPHQEVGLAMMRKFLEDAGLLGAVAGPELVLTEVVGQALQEVEHG